MVELIDTILDSCEVGGEAFPGSMSKMSPAWAASPTQDAGT